jgi:hypothetical protein
VGDIKAGRLEKPIGEDEQKQSVNATDNAIYVDLERAL